jgi:hypothetical protein
MTRVSRHSPKARTCRSAPLKESPPLPVNNPSRGRPKIVNYGFLSASRMFRHRPRLQTPADKLQPLSALKRRVAGTGRPSALGRVVSMRLAYQVSQSAKEDDYRIAIAGTRRPHRSQAPFRIVRPIALTAQFLHAGTDRLEVISSTGLSHVSSSIRLADLDDRCIACEAPEEAIVLGSNFGGKPRPPSRSNRNADRTHF